MLIPMVYILPLYYAHYFYNIFPALVKAGHVFVAMPPLFRIDFGKEVLLCIR